MVHHFKPESMHSEFKFFVCQLDFQPGSAGCIAPEIQTAKVITLNSQACFSDYILSIASRYLLQQSLAASYFYSSPEG